MGAYVDVTEATFEADVLKKSFEAPVVVDFWAAWCGPCRALGPVLEKLAGEADGEWTLAKVDVDANQYLASAFGIQGIPAVKAFKDGKLAAEFTGALPEEQIRVWLKQLQPSEAEIAFARARVEESRGDVAAARTSYEAVLADQPNHREARAALERLDLESRVGEADIAVLEDRLHRDPDDVDALCSMSDVMFAKGDVQAAADLLTPAIARSNGETRDALRTHLLKLLDTLPVDDPVAMAARRSLARVLF